MSLSCWQSPEIGNSITPEVYVEMNLVLSKMPGTQRSWCEIWSDIEKDPVKRRRKQSFLSLGFNLSSFDAVIRFGFVNFGYEIGKLSLFILLLLDYTRNRVKYYSTRSPLRLYAKMWSLVRNGLTVYVASVYKTWRASRGREEPTKTHPRT